MSRLLTPKFLLRGFEISSWPRWWASGSLCSTATTSRPSCAASGASTGAGFWWGSGWRRWTGWAAGFRLWVVARHVYPRPSLKGMILAGGMGAWAGTSRRSTPGAGPMTMYTMRRYGVPLPVAVTSTFMSFVATDSLLRHRGAAGALLRGRAVAGPARQRARPLALRSVPRQPHDHRRHRRADGGRDLLSPAGPGPDSPGGGGGRPAKPAGGASAWSGCRGHRPGARQRRRLQQSARLAGARSGRRSSPARPTPNKLLAGYVALRALGIHANFVDILLLQTLVMFLLYFAPTPGASGIGEVLSAAVMSSYVPRELTPHLHSHLAAHPDYFTIAFGLPGVLELGAARAQGVEETALAEPADGHEPDPGRHRGPGQEATTPRCSGGCSVYLEPYRGLTGLAAAPAARSAGLALVGPGAHRARARRGDSRDRTSDCSAP